MIKVSWKAVKFGKIRNFEFRQKQEIVNFISKNSDKKKAPTEKMNKTKFVELNFYFRS